ncbi:MAG: cyclic nucleotide-binding domain-containing protein [Rhodocyclaceae bacterium]|nr:cyclic nucleotide-binding domain-containing protein [Rhodocyclaceae bacterium]
MRAAPHQQAPAKALAGCEKLGDAVSQVPKLLALMNHIRLFGDFTPEEVTLLSHYLVCYRVPRGTEVVREGEVGDFMLLLIEGEMEIVKRAPNGLLERLAVVGPGKTLGEMSLIDGEPRFATCIALSDCVVAVLDRSTLVQLTAAAPIFGVKLLTSLLQLLNQRLRTVGSELVKCLYQQRLRIR